MYMSVALQVYRRLDVNLGSYEQDLRDLYDCDPSSSDAIKVKLIGQGQRLGFEYCLTVVILQF